MHLYLSSQRGEPEKEVEENEIDKLMALTPKQEKACQAYVKLGDKSAAYREAYSTKKMKAATINRKAVELFQNGKVTARVEELQKKIESRNEITVDQVVRRLKEIGFQNENDRVAALDKLMKHLGGYGKDNNQKTPPAFVVFDARNKPFHK